MNIPVILKSYSTSSLHLLRGLPPFLLPSTVPYAQSVLLPTHRTPQWGIQYRGWRYGFELNPHPQTQFLKND